MVVGRVVANMMLDMSVRVWLLDLTYAIFYVMQSDYEVRNVKHVFSQVVYLF